MRLPGVPCATQRYGRWWDPDTSTPTVSDDTWESYRYDALGRRIIKRRLHEPFCDEACTATIERTIWNGSQILVELRASGDPADTTALSNQTESGRDFGRVAYVHGPEIDAPLAVYRAQFLGSSTVRVLPRANWRGQYEGGVFSGGWPECTGSNGPNCIYVDWPAPLMHTYLDGQRRPQGDWMGSLLQDQRDASGLLFRRNRYYDPATGQFTQQDPIGIAGGMNLYGFANGDPVNFSDPFGLCPVCGVAGLAALGGGLVDAGIQAAANALVGRPILEGTGRAFAFGAAAGVAGFGIGRWIGRGASAARSVASGARFPTKPGQLKHLFRAEDGHLLDTPANRGLLKGLADDASATLGTDRFGNVWSARTLEDGSQAWVSTRNGVIQNGGVNANPRRFDPDLGLSNPGR
ncbi:RHS repeat-associated core domain-containing protein [Gaopeijia maritima]|uniref:RHS repeat-associated core domain-containing protein n=1 Tax=Gaopeijia maritima TaxID=3119007 RepID=A0ABU9EBD2_9BACT